VGESRKAPLIVAKMHAGRYHSPFQPSSLAQTLREAYAQGAFERATLHDAVRAARMATRRYEGCPLASAAAIDPFEVFDWVRMCYEWSCSRSRGTRRIVHWNVTAHPTAEWTAQQCRMVVPGDQRHRFVIQDRDTIYSEQIDRTFEAMGLVVLKTPVRVPQANAFCERLVGTMRTRAGGLCVIPVVRRSRGLHSGVVRTTHRSPFYGP
jgi:hypothetical protein